MATIGGSWMGAADLLSLGRDRVIRASVDLQL